MNRLNPYLFVGLLLLLSCTQSIHSEKELLSFIGDPANGFIKEKIIGDKKITVKYLPPQYFAFREDLKNQNAITEEYGHNLHFLLSIGYADQKGDIMYDNIADRESYSQRVHELNFALEEQVLLKCNGKEFQPVLTNMENTYGLQPFRNFMLVFTPAHEADFKNTKELEFIFNDSQFETGLHHFVFEAEDIHQKILIKI